MEWGGNRSGRVREKAQKQTDNQPRRTKANSRRKQASIAHKRKWLGSCPKEISEDVEAPKND